MQRLYAIAYGNDLSDIEDQLVHAFAEFVHSWRVTGVELVNVKSPPIPGDDLRDWVIGLYAETEGLKPRDIEDLVSFLARLSREVNLELAVGIARRPHSPKQLCVIDGHIPDGAVGDILNGVHAA
jgi:hypothetical protein